MGWPILHRDYTRERLQQTADRMRALVYPETRAPALLLVSPPVGYLTPEEAASLKYRPAELGMPLGPKWTTFWCRIEATIPDAWAGRRVDPIWETGSESTLWMVTSTVVARTRPGWLDAPRLVTIASGT